MKRSLAWALCAFSLLAASANAQVVISQVYGGGGNNGATYKNDFIELFNQGSTSVSVAGWSVQYASSTGTNWSNKKDLTGTIPPGGYYLIQGAGGATGALLPTADVTSTINLSGSTGKVALVSTPGLTLTGGCPTGVVDFVGYGAANCFEGGGPAPALDNAMAAVRDGAGCADTDDNQTDFSKLTPNPRNSAAPTVVCGPRPPLAKATVSPASAEPGASALITVTVKLGSSPESPILEVVGDLSAIGGSAAQPFQPSASNTFTFNAMIAPSTPLGPKTIAITATDLLGRTGTASILLKVEGEHVVISQVYGGGGNGGSLYNRDFVELYNPTIETVDLSGWSIQYGSSSGEWASFQPLAGTIGPGEYYLAALSFGSANTGELPPANIEGTYVSMSGSDGKVALVRNLALIEGPCLADPDIVDLVGYGGANCSEGAPAQSLTNSTALFRNNGGATDSFNNASDFTRGTPDPRRTAPIVPNPEFGPWISQTEPRANGTNAPRDASVQITFSEAVEVDGGWFSINCASSGLHDDVTLAYAGASVVITPNRAFTPGEYCTVTIAGARIHDADTNDSGAGTDTLVSDPTWTFRITAATEPPYSSDVHLLMGNPSGARPDLDAPANYLMVKPEFALSYNRDRGTPNWVSWHLSSEWTATGRFESFRPDPKIPVDWYRVQGFDYSGSGFNRGHVIPSADRNKAIAFNQATFLMTNMIPQAPDNNQGPWAKLEEELRILLGEDKEAYVIAGGAGTGGAGDEGFAYTIANGHVAVPAHTWKVALVLPKLDGNDIESVTGTARTIAVIMPNVQGIMDDPWINYLTTVDAVEAMTGYDFFANVTDAIEVAIEAGRNGVNPPVDLTPPQISTLTLSRTSLWPANHKMVDVTVSYTATDSADPAPSCALTVSSNEPQDGTGDGDTGPDWEVVDSNTVRLRAERAGTGDGRIYTIAVACRDVSGNLAIQTAQVSVPLSSR